MTWEVEERRVDEHIAEKKVELAEKKFIRDSNRQHEEQIRNDIELANMQVYIDTSRIFLNLRQFPTKTNDAFLFYERPKTQTNSL